MLLLDHLRHHHCHDTSTKYFVLPFQLHQGFQRASHLSPASQGAERPDEHVQPGLVGPRRDGARHEVHLQDGRAHGGGNHQPSLPGFFTLHPKPKRAFRHSFGYFYS